jgi:hypothetical protein
MPALICANHRKAMRRRQFQFTPTPLIPGISHTKCPARIQALNELFSA